MDIAGPRTLRDHFARSPGELPDRFERLCNIVVDGCKLGDYPTDGSLDREGVKRFEELQWAAVALVGCNADVELSELRSLPTRPGMATADFQAVARSGRRIRLELARITFGSERQQNEYFASIAGKAQQNLERLGFVDQGEFIYRTYDPNNTPISRSDADLAARELASLIAHDLRLHAVSRTLHPVADANRYPTLHRLHTYVCHASSEGPTSVLWDPPLESLNVSAATAAFNRIRARKAGKVNQYSDDGRYPVWLVFGAQSLRQRFLALGTVDHLATLNTIDPRPFERILVGCYTAGVTFVESGRKPIYTSLTTTG